MPLFTVDSLPNPFLFNVYSTSENVFNEQPFS